MKVYKQRNANAARPARSRYKAALKAQQQENLEEAKKLFGEAALIYQEAAYQDPWTREATPEHPRTGYLNPWFFYAAVCYEKAGNLSDAFHVVNMVPADTELGQRVDTVMGGLCQRIEKLYETAQNTSDGQEAKRLFQEVIPQLEDAGLFYWSRDQEKSMRLSRYIPLIREKIGEILEQEGLSTEDTEKAKKLFHEAARSYERAIKRGVVNEKGKELRQRITACYERAGEFLEAVDFYHQAEMPEKAVGAYIREAEQTRDVTFRRLQIVEAVKYARRAGLEEQARVLYGMMIEECRKIGDGKSLEEAANLTLNATGDIKAAEDLYRRAAWAYLREDKCPIPLLKRSGIAEKAYRNLAALGKSEKAGWLCGLVEDYSRFPSYKIPRKMDSVVIDILILSKTPGVAVVESKEVLPVLQ